MTSKVHCILLKQQLHCFCSLSSKRSTFHVSQQLSTLRAQVLRSRRASGRKTPLERVPKQTVSDTGFVLQKPEELSSKYRDLHQAPAQPSFLIALIHGTSLGLVHTKNTVRRHSLGSEFLKWIWYQIDVGRERLRGGGAGLRVSSVCNLTK